MEKIRQAVERARADRQTSKSDVLDDLPVRRVSSSATSQGIVDDNPVVPPALREHRAEEIELSAKFLESKRIVSYDGKDIRSRPYDMLRTQILQSMDANGWKVLGITSPTPRCGKTVTATNLGFSIARQPERSVALVDLDLQRPQISHYFGIVPPSEGALGVLEGRTTLRNVTMPVRAGNQQMVVIPTAATKVSAEFMSSRTLGQLLRDLRKDFQIVLLDLPPILSSDDVIALLPQIDCVLLVTAVGLTKASEVEECMRHMHPSQLIRVVLNKATETDTSYILLKSEVCSV